MAKKKGGGRPPRNLNLIGKGEKQTQQQILDKGKSEKGLTHVQRYEKQKAEAAKDNPKSKIILQNKIEAAKKQPQKEPDKAKEPQKTKQHDIEKDKE